MTATHHELSTTLWRWSGGANGGDWLFATVEGEAGEALCAAALMHRLETGRRSGWGSVKVEARVGRTEWRTSAFPSKEHGWIVPVKASVRRAEALAENVPFVLCLSF